MYIVITNEYPSLKKLYANAFVHRRVINYLDRGMKVVVFVCNDEVSEFEQYEFEGVKVLKGNIADLKREIEKSKYKKLLIHIINKDIIKGIESSKSEIPILLWLHGSEAEAWYRRWFNYNLFLPTQLFSFLYNSLANIKRLKEIKNFINKNKDRITIITVSNWFLKIIKKDIGIKNIKYYVIPNVIDPNLFTHNIKDDSHRYKILSVRPFTSRVYANDISIKVIEELSKSEEFSRLSILLIGDGKLFESLTKKLNKFNNVTCLKKMLTQPEISELYNEYGVFLSPARWDTHGVSRCEAMSSGLVPITSDVAAIPEFVSKESGVLGKDVKEMSEAIINLVKNPDLYKKMSNFSATSIRDKCSNDNTILKEIELIER